MFNAVHAELKRLNEAETAARFGEAQVHAPRPSDPIPRAETPFDALLPAEMAVRAEKNRAAGRSHASPGCALHARLPRAAEYG